MDQRRRGSGGFIDRGKWDVVVYGNPFQDDNYTKHLEWEIQNWSKKFRSLKMNLETVQTWLSTTETKDLMEREV